MQGPRIYGVRALGFRKACRKRAFWALLFCVLCLWDMMRMYSSSKCDRAAMSGVLFQQMSLFPCVPMQKHHQVWTRAKDICEKLNPKP